MEYNPGIHHRKSIRLKHYDYSQEGYYYVTICTKNMERWFGDVVNGKMKLSAVGEIVKKCWMEIPQHFDNAFLDVFVVMPNHFHGIVVIENERNAPCRGGVTPPLLQRRTLGQIIAYFKYHSTRIINQIRNTPGIPLWHRNYYEHIIRNEKELYYKRKYIMNNPIKWEIDGNNPDKSKQIIKFIDVCY